MKLITFFLLVLLSICLTAEEKHDEIINNQKFILITVLYNEPHEARVNEYITCLERNLNHNMIEKIHVIYDTSHDQKTEERMVLNYLWSKDVEITYIKDRPSFAFCFSLANDLYPHRRIIFSNADIYFNETLNLLKEYDFTNIFMALTRWNDNGKGNLKQFNSNSSQDVWILETPIRDFCPDNICIGTWNCEPWLMLSARKARFTIVNPCYTIQCCHLHTSLIRHYNRYQYPRGFRAVGWSHL